jgi:hypothetical protein
MINTQKEIDWVLRDLRAFRLALHREEALPSQWLPTNERASSRWEALVSSCTMESAASYRDQLVEVKGGGRSEEESWTQWVLYTYPKTWEEDLVQAVAIAKTGWQRSYSCPGGSYTQEPYARAQNGRVLVTQSGGLDI